MVIHLKPTIDATMAQELANKYQAMHFKNGAGFVLVTSSKSSPDKEELAAIADATFDFKSDIQLASRDYKSTTRTVDIGNGAIVGGNTNNTLMITGPCSVESEAQIDQVAQFCVERGIKVLRAGCFKPRTSPYTFQGMGREGLALLVQMREKYGLRIITEVKDATHVDDVIEHADIIQIGAKAMYDHGILNACAKTKKPVLIKRGFGTTLQEFVQSAEFVLSGGNEKVMLCERGIRTFETHTRFTLDLCGVAYLKQHVNLPIILDPSHAMGYAYGVADLTRACVAMGIEGLLIETHPTPAKAMSDAAQQLDFNEFTQLQDSLQVVAQSVGRQMI